MKKLLLLILLLLTCTSMNAQQVWQSHMFEAFTWDVSEQEYIKTQSSWEKSRFILHREYIVLETKPGVFKKIWWVFYDDKTLGTCYITEGDTHKICVDYDAGRIYIFGDHADKRYQSCGVLSKISKVE